MEVSFLEATGLLGCFILSGFFAGSEAVLMSISLDRARQLIEEAGPKGRALTFMVERPGELLATILVGNNLVNIWASSLVTILASRFFESQAMAISVGVTTFVILIFGEIIPKTFARNHAEVLCAFVIRILQGTYYLLYPVICGVVWIMETVLGESARNRGRIVTKNDIEYMVGRAEREKTMDSKQLDMLSSILEFPRIKVKDIMIPRSKVKWIQKNSSFDRAMRYIKNHVHSRYPVIDEKKDSVVGFLHVKDLAFLGPKQRESFSLEKYVKPPFFVYEHMKIQTIFDSMNRKKIHLAMVKDENGMVVGIVTLEDIVEEVLGEIQDEYDPEEKKKELSDHENGGAVAMDPSISLRDLDAQYEIKIPLNDNYSTLAGFLLDMLGNHFPEEGQIIVWEGYSFEISQVEDNELKKVLIRDVEGQNPIFSRGGPPLLEKTPS